MEELRTMFLSSDPETMLVRYILKEPTSPDMPNAELQRSLLEQLASTRHILLKRQDDQTYEVTWQFEFETLHRKQQELVKGLQVQSGEPVRFDNDTARLSLGDNIAQLPPFKKEHQLCEIMFRYRAGEPVDTSSIYEEMTGSDDWDDKTQRMIKDVVRAINKRAVENLGIPELFKREENTIRRIF